MSKLILVTGATGQVGGAVARELLMHGFKVRAFTFSNNESSGSGKRKQLEKLGAQIFNGDMSELTSLTEAMKDVYGVFSVQPPSFPPSKQADEYEYYLGINVACAAKEIGVKQFVYSSVLGSEDRTAYRPLFKYQIEEYIRKVGLSATIFKPSLFMETFCLPFYGLSQGKLFNAAPFDLAMPIISVEDIGVLVRLAFQQPERFIGKTMNIAGDRRTISEIADVLSRTFGRKITPVQIPLKVVKEQNAIHGRIMEDYYSYGYADVNIEELRMLHPGLMTLESWIHVVGRDRLSELIR